MVSADSRPMMSCSSVQSGDGSSCTQGKYSPRTDLKQHDAPVAQRDESAAVCGSSPPTRCAEETVAAAPTPLGDAQGRSWGENLASPDRVM
jgi:hypothetical protein